MSKQQMMMIIETRHTTHNLHCNNTRSFVCNNFLVS